MAFDDVALRWAAAETRGAVRRVSVAFDTTVDWRLYDESVVALTDPAAADRLPWFPERRPRLGS